MGSRLMQACWVFGLGLILAVGTRASAQIIVSPPRPLPVNPADTPLPPPASLGPLIQPASPLTFAPVPPPPPPVLDPGRDGYGPLGSVSQNQGWFFDAEIILVFPNLRYLATNDRPLPNTGATLNVPTTGISTTVSPTFEAGYRLGDSLGLFAVSYKFLNSDGTGTANVGGMDYAVRTRASINTVDLDYGTNPYEFLPRYTFSWRLGARISDINFDSQARSGQMLQMASSDFFGAGPHARLDLERRIVTIPGLSLFGRLDGAVLVGQVKQDFRLEAPDGMGNVLVDTGNIHRSQAVPEINLQVGLTYVVQSVPGLKVTGGYDFMEIYNVGRLGELIDGTVSRTRGQITTNGIFLRGQYDF
jgi:Legionella pneumophila major outer membrane protein precursor